MNIKVVVIWGIAIVLFAAIGIFGYVNQGLLSSEPKDEVYIPNAGSGESKTCTKMLAKGTSAYRFQMDDANSITKVVMTYTAKTQDIEAYSAANAINSTSMNGISTALSGGASDFLLIVTVDLNAYDRAALESIRANLSVLSMVVDNIKDYASYQTAINANDTANPYICD